MPDVIARLRRLTPPARLACCAGSAAGCGAHFCASRATQANWINTVWECFSVTFPTLVLDEETVDKDVVREKVRIGFAS